jgi:hypothetical protein
MFAALTILLLASPPEDAAHRADRLQTERLNRSVSAEVRDRDRANDRERARYEAARAAYRRDMANWQRRVSSCEAGEYAAC